MDIRRKLFRLQDLLGLLLAFCAAGWLAPWLHGQLSPGGPFYGHWVESLSPVDAGQGSTPLPEFLWVFILAAPVTMISLGLLGGHNSLRTQRSIRILFVSLAASMAGTGLLSIVFYVLRTPGYSRLFVFSFAAASCVCLCVPRLIGRAWCNWRLRQGAYAEEFAIIASSDIAGVLTDLLQATSTIDHRCVGRFTLPPRGISTQHKETPGTPILGDVTDVETVLV